MLRVRVHKQVGWLQADQVPRLVEGRSLPEGAMARKLRGGKYWELGSDQSGLAQPLPPLRRTDFNDFEILTHPHRPDQLIAIPFVVNSVTSGDRPPSQYTSCPPCFPGRPDRLCELAPLRLFLPGTSEVTSLQPQIRSPSSPLPVRGDTDGSEPDGARRMPETDGGRRAGGGPRLRRTEARRGNRCIPGLS